MFGRDVRRRETTPGVPPDDWLPGVARSAERDALLASASGACCCSAWPAVVVLMPPSPTRRHYIDLLLCRHHYRASRQALSAAGAMVLDPDNGPAAAQPMHLETQQSQRR